MRLAVGDHAALGHHDHPVGVVHHHLHVVLDEQEGDALLGAEPLHVVEQPAPEGGVDPGHRLVEEQEARLGHQRPCELEQLPLTARERARVMIPERGEVEDLEQLHRLLADFRLSPPRGAGAKQHVYQPLARLIASAEHHVVDHRHSGQRLGDLEGPNHAEAGDRVGRAAEDVPAAERRRTSIRAVETGDHVEEGRLAGAVGPDQRGDRAVANPKAGTVHGADAAEALDDAVGLEDRAVRGRRRRCGCVGHLSHRAPSPRAFRTSPVGGTPSARSESARR